MYSLQITLKQHTPLIHFQHDQEGATLRASEVKPRLDRFILNQLGKKASIYEKELISSRYKENTKKWDDYLYGFEIAKEKGLLIGNGGKPALNFKMRISHTNEKNSKKYIVASHINKKNIELFAKEKIDILNETSFFAQEKEMNQIISNLKKKDFNIIIPKKGVIYQDDINITIQSLNITVIQYIVKQIQTFFIINNFGTRQSKGFGCFEVIKIRLDGKEIELMKNVELLKSNFSIVYSKEINNNLKEIFKTINKDYKILKSGDSLRKKPSELMLYGLKYLEKQWEKNFLRKKIYNWFKIEKSEQYYILKSQNNGLINDYNEKEFKFIRSLLGLADQYEFLLENPPKNDIKNKLIVKVRNNNGIDRIQSPILFKVFDKKLYLLGNEINKTILGKNFYFTVSIQGDDCWDDALIEPEIEIPSEFSLKEFIDIALENNNKLNYIKIK